MTRLHQSREPNRYRKRGMFFDVYMGVKDLVKVVNTDFPTWIIQHARGFRNYLYQQQPDEMWQYR